MSSHLDIIILSAGKGTRMRSSLPKVLHALGGKPLLQHVVDTAKKLHPENIFIVVGHESEQIKNHFKDDKACQFVHQASQLGTAHALMQALPLVQNPSQKILILYGDVPLISTITLENLIQAFDNDKNAELGILSATVSQPHGLGRIIRNTDHKIVGIVEENDASPTEKKIQEINTGIYISTAGHLINILEKVKPHNAQGEYYLTDIAASGSNIVNIMLTESDEICGVNDLEQLHQLECRYQALLAKHLRLQGVTVGPGVIFEGSIEIGANSKIGAYCILKNVSIGEEVEIKPHCVIEDAVIKNHCKIGPFARIRPGTQLEHSVAVGNFTEIKNSNIGETSKIPHLSYIGDAEVGQKVNIGAGVITCNYNGVKKQKTIIGDNVFIGSDAQLIAPVTIASGAYIGAGSTITKDAPKDKLTLSRAKQVTLDHWQKPK